MQQPTSARNVRFVLLSTVLTSLAVSGPSVTRAADFGKFRGGGIVGVWMGLISPGLSSYAPVPRWYTFFDDGQAFTDLPDEGLTEFDRAASKVSARRDYWGTYRFAGGKGLHARAPLRRRSGETGQLQRIPRR